MIVHKVEQRSEEWHRLRAGRVTGSAANAILAVRQKGTGELAVRRDLRQRLIVEQLTGNPMEDSGYKSKAMEHGIDTEQEALNAYEAATGEIVTRVGFVSHDTLMAGCSPDGCVGAWDGAIEIKCPDSDTHLEYLQADAIPKEYVGQCVHTLWITGAQWVDFCSYDPRFPEPMRLFRKRLTREGIDFTAYALAVSLLLTEVETAVAKLQPEDIHAFEKDPNEIGCLWLKTSPKGEYFSGVINGENVVVFPTHSKNPKAPNFRVLKSVPKAKADGADQRTQLDDF